MCKSQDPWLSHYKYKRQMFHQVSHTIDLALMNRTETTRDQVADDRLFEPLNRAMDRAIAHKDYLFAIELFQNSLKIAIDYEKNQSAEIHKGAMAFNAALCYLRTFDFVAAIHFFELAQEEDKKTTNNDNWKLYEAELFRRHYWHVLESFEKEKPLSIYMELWGVSYGEAIALADWQELSSHSKIGYIIALAQRLRYIKLAELSPWITSESLRLAYWYLLANLTRLIETELRSHGLHEKGLLAIILNRMGDQRIANFSSKVQKLHKSCQPVPFDKSYAITEQQIQDRNLPRQDRIVAAAYHAGLCRNQLQHKIDTSCNLFKDIDKAQFTLEVLISLCRISGWVS